ncbi:MAG: squalene synthase HpnC [Betaproteobacteria bacterium]
MPVNHYENFPVASRLVPANVRGAVVAIYAFARNADDFADEGDAPAAQRIAALDRYAALLDRIAGGERPDEAPFPALTDAIRAHGLPLAPMHALLSAFRQDVLKTRYADFAEVEDYCARSANPIGRLLLHLYGVGDAASLRRSDAICTALQLTNFWQDVALDWGKDRIYVPLDDMRRFGVGERHIADADCDDAWRSLMRFETARTRSMLVDGRALAQSLPWRLRLELRMVVAGGLRILRRIDDVGGDVFRHRPTLTTRDWSAMSLAALRA